ncbi:MAG TPA: ABC transporter substrate-binding protein [Xanthobacteraceae bacterium]|jgi:NitT/TauT family transport system substrate-binding protein|nr:ABC transporter substrate-binding protein [Xanthobacteraceae bacterium]
MAPMKKIQTWLLAAAAVVAMTALGARAQAQELTIGTIGAASDAPLFIADAKGYFAEQGLKVKFVRFDSAAKMIPSLSSGEVDVGSGATSAGLYNAVARGIGIKIVADKARNTKNYSFENIMVRTDLYDSGKVKSLKDFKGLKVAISAKGNSEDALINYALTKVGLSIKDIDPVYLGFPNHIAAYANKGIDASLTVEPTVTKLLQLGAAKKLMTADEIFPGFQTAVIFYSPKFTQQKDTANKFMVALVKAMRFYDDSLEGGHIAGPNSDEVIDILVKYSFLKDPKVHRAIVSQVVDPNGNLNVPALEMAWKYFKDVGEIDGKVSVKDVIDLSYVQAATKVLGPYNKKIDE